MEAIQDRSSWHSIFEASPIVEFYSLIMIKVNKIKRIQNRKLKLQT